jgi:hypothetical protein
MRAAALAFFAIASCATGYGPAGFGSGGGYSEHRLDERTFLVTFEGNRRTLAAQVAAMLHRRCAEVTVASGFDFFAVVERATETQRSVRSVGGAFGDSSSAIGWGRSKEHKEHAASVVIRIFRAAEQRPEGATDAREVLKYMDPKPAEPKNDSSGVLSVRPSL